MWAADACSATAKIQVTKAPPALVDVGDQWAFTPVARLFDSNGLPLAGKRVRTRARPAPCGHSELGYPDARAALQALLSPSFTGFRELYFPGTRMDLAQPTVAVLTGAVSEPSDMSGIARWTDVRVNASGLAYVRLAVTCDGVVNSTFIGSTIAVRSRVAGVRIVRQPHGPVIEGRALPATPTAQVVDASGSPIASQRAVAYLYKEAGVETAFQIAPNSLRDLNALSLGPAAEGHSKRLRGLISTPSDQQGILHFPHLGFTLSGPVGTYSIVVYAAGVASAPSSEIVVRAAPLNVTMLSTPAAPIPANVWTGPNAWGTFSHRTDVPFYPLSSGALRGLPALRVRDRGGSPVAGKAATLRGKLRSCAGRGATGATDLVAAEFPRPGNQQSDRYGIISYTDSRRIRMDSSARIQECVSNTRCQSYFRVLSSAGRACVYEAWFDVQGSTTDTFAILATNWDAIHFPNTTLRGRPVPDRWNGSLFGGPPEPPQANAPPRAGDFNGSDTQCGRLEVVAAPSVAHVGDAMGPIRIRALNSYGAPLQRTWVAVFLSSGVGPLRASGAPSAMKHLLSAYWEMDPSATAAFYKTATAGVIGRAQVLGQAVTDDDGVATIQGTLVEGQPAWVRLRAVSIHHLASPERAKQTYEAPFVCEAPEDVVMSLKNDFKVKIVQRPGGCAAPGSPFAQRMRVRVTDGTGAPVAGAAVDAGMLIGPNGEGAPASTLRDLLYEDGFPFLLWLPLQLGTTGHRLLKHSRAVTDRDGVAAFADFALRDGHPGNYTFVAQAYGVLSEPVKHVECPLLVSDLRVRLVRNCTAFSPTNTSIHGLAPEDQSPYLTNYRSSEFTGQPVSCFTASTRCRTAPNGVECSGHGSCHCGVCFCDAEWTGSVDCGTRVDPANAVWRRSPIPVVAIRSIIPAFLFGEVRVLSADGSPLPGYSVQAHLVHCDSGERVRDAIVSVGQPCPDYFATTHLASSPSDGNGIATFGRYPMFPAVASPGCYAFRYSVYSSSLRDPVTGKVFSPGKGAVRAQQLSQPFVVATPVLSVNVSAPPSTVAAPGSVLANQPVFRIVADPDNTRPFLSQNGSTCGLEDLHARPGLCTPDPTQTPVCPPGGGIPVLALLRRLATGAYHRLFVEGSTAFCTRALLRGKPRVVNGRLLYTVEARFTQLFVPRMTARERLSSTSFKRVRLGEGDYEWALEINGVVVNTGAVVHVTSSLYSLALSQTDGEGAAGNAVQTGAVVAVGNLTPLWNTTAFVNPQGAALPGASLSLALLAADDASPLWALQGAHAAAPPSDAFLLALAHRVAREAAAAERRREVQAASRALGLSTPQQYREPNASAMTREEAIVYRSVPLFADETQRHLASGRQGTSALSAETDDKGRASIGRALVRYGRTGVYILKITSNAADSRATMLAGALASAGAWRVHTDGGTSVKAPSSISEVASSTCQAQQRLSASSRAAESLSGDLAMRAALVGNATLFVPLVIRNPVARFLVSVDPIAPGLDKAARATARRVSTGDGDTPFANPTVAVASDTSRASIRVCAVGADGKTMPDLPMTVHVTRPVRVQGGDNADTAVQYQSVNHITLKDQWTFAPRTGRNGCFHVKTLQFSMSAGPSQRVALLFEHLGVMSPPVNVTLLTFADANPWSVSGLTSAMFLPAAVVSPLLASNTLFSDKPGARLLAVAAGMCSVIFLGSWGAVVFDAQHQELQRHFDPRFTRYVAVLDWVYSALCGVSLAYLAAVTAMHVLHRPGAAVAERVRRTCRGSAAPSKPWLCAATDAHAVHNPAAWRRLASRDFVEHAAFEPPRSRWRGRQFARTKAAAYSHYAVHASPRTHAILVEKDGTLTCKAADAISEVYDRFAAGPVELARRHELVQLLRDTAAQVRPLAHARPGVIRGDGGAARKPAPAETPPRPRAREAETANPLFGSVSFSESGGSAAGAGPSASDGGRGGEAGPMKRAAVYSPRAAGDSDGAYLLGALEEKGYSRLLSGTMTKDEFVEWFAARLRLGALWPRPPPEAVQFVRDAQNENARLQGKCCSLRASKLGEAARRVQCALVKPLYIRDRVVWAQLRALGYDAKLRRRVVTPIDGAEQVPASPATEERLREELASGNPVASVKLWRDPQWVLTHAGDTALGAAMRKWSQDGAARLDYATLKRFMRRGGQEEPPYRMHAYCVANVVERDGEGCGFGPRSLLQCLCQRYPRTVDHELRSLLRRHGFNSQLIQSPEREVSAPFFYPQRVLTAAVLSSLAVLLMAMWTDSLAVRATLLVDDAWREALDMQERASNLAQDAVRSQVAAMQQQAMEVAIGAQNADAANAVAAAVSDSQTGQQTRSEVLAQLGSATGGDRSGGSLNGRANDLAGQIVNGYLSTRGLAQFEPAKEAFKTMFHDASRIGAAAAVMVMAVCWVLMLRTYRRRVLAARRGRYVLYWRNNRISNATNYSGLMLSLTGLGFVLSWVPLTALAFALMWERSRRAMWTFLVSSLGSLLSVSVVLSVLQTAVMSYLLVRNNHIVHRRLFMIGDVFFSFFQLFKGLFVALVRLILVVAFFGALSRRAWGIGEARPKQHTP